LFSLSSDDLRAARESVVFAPVPLGALIVRGPDRRKFLHGLLTADILALKPGAWAPAFLLTARGRVVAELAVYDRGEELLLLTRPWLAEGLARALSKTIMLTESSLEDASARLGALALVGPRAPGPPLVASRFWGPSRIHFRLGETPDRHAEVLTAAGVRRVGLDALEALRVEAGVAAVGPDTDAETFPLELNAEEAVSFDKGCYLGQETTAKMKNLGHANRRLARVALEKEAPEGTPLFAGAEAVGRVTSLALLPERGICGLALLKTAAAAPGTRLTAGSVAAVVW